MAMVRSGWAKSSPLISGSFSPGEWDNAGKLPIVVKLPNPVAYLLVKNDSQYLYLAIDLIGDTGNDIGTHDYVLLGFDVDGNRCITPLVDVLYGIWPPTPNRLVRCYYTGPRVSTAPLPGPSTSMIRQGFGTSPNPGGTTPHRIWELRIDLAEIGMSLTGTTTLPVIGFGLQVLSSSPPFCYNYPPDFLDSFSNLPQIALSLGPDTDPPESGLVIGTVGIIPTGSKIIVGGRATTDKTYDPFVQNAAFGGTMHLRGNHEKMLNLWNHGARKYKMLHRDSTIPLLTPFPPILQSWSNYHWTGKDWVLESFSPDADGKYMMLDPNQEYSIHNLLFQWSSNGFLPGIHQFQVQFFKNDGTPVDAPKQTLDLYLDNNLPDLQIIGVKYKNQNIYPCQIVDVDETADPVQIHIRAFDTEGDLRKYVLDAYYGSNAIFSPSLADVSYPGSGNWQGDADRWISAPVNPKFPPTTCAYQLRLWALPRVTNGYGYIGYNEATYHITFKVPTAATMAPLGAGSILGFSGNSNKKGTKPRKSGR